jgi:hypothetical protein
MFRAGFVFVLLFGLAIFSNPLHRRLVPLVVAAPFDAMKRWVGQQLRQHSSVSLLLSSPPAMRHLRRGLSLCGRRAVPRVWPGLRFNVLVPRVTILPIFSEQSSFLFEIELQTCPVPNVLCARSHLRGVGTAAHVQQL